MQERTFFVVMALLETTGLGQKFLSPPTNYLIRYFIRSINLPHFGKNQHYRMTEFCANFGISSKFFNILYTFSDHFSIVVNDRFY